LGTFLAIESTGYDTKDKVTKNEQKVKQDNCFKKSLFPRIGFLLNTFFMKSMLQSMS
jgi:hypothetical protein